MAWATWGPREVCLVGDPSRKVHGYSVEGVKGKAEPEAQGR